MIRTGIFIFITTTLLLAAMPAAGQDYIDKDKIMTVRGRVIDIFCVGFVYAGNSNDTASVLARIKKKTASSLAVIVEDLARVSRNIAAAG